MAIEEVRSLPPEYIEALGKTYAADLTRQAGIPSITTANAKQPGESDLQFSQRQAQAQQFGITKAGMADLAPQLAAQDAYQTQAYTQAADPTTGLGAYQPFLQKAGTAADAAGGLTGTGVNTLAPQTGPATSAGSIASYMSPYQQQVIDASLADFDQQAAKSRLNLGAVAGGAFGGGRQGIREAEYDAQSDRSRSTLQAGLRQSGFQSAQQSRQQDLQNQMGLSNLQSGLGGTAQGFAQSQIAGLGTLGAAQQAQDQAGLDVARQTAQMAVDDPRRRLDMLGQGISGLTPGAGTVQISDVPDARSASPLESALGAGLMGADIYGRIFGPKK